MSALPPPAAVAARPVKDQLGVKLPKDGKSASAQTHLPDIKQQPQLPTPLGGSGAGSAAERGSRGGAAPGRAEPAPGRAGGSIVFYKEQETSLQEDMKGT